MSSHFSGRDDNPAPRPGGLHERRGIIPVTGPELVAAVPYPDRSIRLKEKECAPLLVHLRIRQPEADDLRLRVPENLPAPQRTATEDDQPESDPYPFQYHIHDPLFLNPFGGPARSIPAMPGGPPRRYIVADTTAPGEHTLTVQRSPFIRRDQYSIDTQDPSSYTPIVKKEVLIY